MTGSRRPESVTAGAPDFDGLERLVAKLDLAEKVSLLTGADYWTLRAQPGIGLRAIHASDGPAGVRGPRWDERDTALNVPAPAALAATWDPRCAELIGELLAAECRRKHVDMLLAPTVNLQRTPFGGRNFEFLGEDPLLTAVLGAAFVHGLQRGGVAATLKHFVANDSETGRFTVDARIGERALHELYLAPFEAIIRTARPWAVMAAYNAVNGHMMTESPMLRGLLKDEWGFDGLVVSDWHACRSTDPAANAGVDLVMPGPSGPWGHALVQAVRDGRVSEASVDDKVLRLLRLATRVGAIDGMPADAGSTRLWTDADAKAALRGTAASGFVLARNESGLLPLDLTGVRRIAVLGPNAAVPRTLGGGSATVFPPYSVSPLDGLRAALPPHVVVVHSPGVRSHTRIPMPRPALLRMADGDRPGALVEFIDAAGTMLYREHRMGGFFTWRTFPETAGKAEVAAVRVTTAVRAESAGRHVIGCSGHGRFRMTLAGTTAFDAALHVPAGTDPTEAYVRPPQRHTAIHLDAGQSVEVVLDHYPEDAGTSFALGGVSFQLNVEEPYAADDEEIARAVRLAREADAAIVVVGTTDEVESEGFDRATLDLPGRQDELVRRVAAVNPRTAVVVNSGAPVLLPWADEAPAVLLTSFPGQEYGNALADVLLGRAEPGGRLPSTWPAAADGLPVTTPSAGVLDYTEGLLIGYRLFDRAGREPRYPFGHGLGYTTWDYRGAEAELSAGGLVVTVRLKNTGTRPGRETVQIYASLLDSRVPRPLRWLAGFGPAEAEPGSEVIARIDVPVRSLAYWDAAIGCWAVEPGSYDLAVGRSSRDIRLTVPVMIAPGGRA